MGQSFAYVKDNKGLMLAEDYPWAEAEHPCRYNVKKSAVEVKDYKFLPAGNEEHLKDAIAAIGPMSVGIEANDAFYSYGSGVYDTKSCTGSINHAVLLIGEFSSKHHEEYSRNEFQDMEVIQN